MAAGCGEAPAVRTVKVPKTERTLAAVVQNGEFAWLFNLSGPVIYFDEYEPVFRRLIDELEFDEGGLPDFETPGGWSRERSAGSAAAISMIRPDNGRPIFLRIVGFPVSDGGGLFDQDQLTAFANILRDRIGLERWEGDWRPAAEASGEYVPASSTDAPVFFDFRGSRAPFYVGSYILPAETAAPIRFEAPVGWEDLGEDSFRLARFQLVEGDATVELTLSRAGGSVEANLARWRGQLDLEPTDGEVSEMTAAGRDARRAEFVGESKAIYGVVIPTGSDNVFVKMTGPPDAVAAAVDVFDAFVSSLNFG